MHSHQSWNVSVCLNALKGFLFTRFPPYIQSATCTPKCGFPSPFRKASKALPSWLSSRQGGAAGPQVRSPRPPRQDTARSTEHSASDCPAQNPALFQNRHFYRAGRGPSAGSFSRAEAPTKALTLTAEEREGAPSWFPFPLNKFSWGLACKCVAGEGSKQKWVAGKWEEEKDDIWSSYGDRNVQTERTHWQWVSPQNSLSITVKWEKEQTGDPPTGISDFPRGFPEEANKYPCISVIITCWF